VADRQQQNVGAALPFTGPTPGSATPNITCSSISLQLLKLFFTNLLMLLVEETNRYCRQYYDTRGDDNPAPQDMYLLLALILKMSHDQHDTLKEYWSRDPKK
jgi:hypothetical protein